VGGIVSPAHVSKVVRTVGDGPLYTVGIGHERHFQRAFLLPLVLNRMAVGEAQNAELPVPHYNRVPPSIPLLFQIPRPPVVAAHVCFFFEEYVLYAGILNLCELLVGRISIKMAMIAMTTNSSMSVKPFLLFMTALLIKTS